MSQSRESEATESVFAYRAKKPLLTGVRTVCHYLVCLVCLFLCNIRGCYWLRELYEADFYKPGIYGSERLWANACDVFHRTPSRGGRGRRTAVDFVMCFGCGEIFSFFLFFLLFFRCGGISCLFFRFFCSNAHVLLQVWGRLDLFTAPLVGGERCVVR